MKVKHVSFDLWKTLIISNKNFGEERLNFLCNEFVTKEFSKDIIKSALSAISPLGDAYGEYFYVGFTPKQLYYMFLHQLYGKKTNELISETNALEILYQKSLEIFSNNIPPLLSDSIPSLLEKLTKSGITLNTSFAGGEHLTLCLKHHNIFKYFKFTVFSERIGVFKPNGAFFQDVYYGAINSHPFISKNQILHVGDNPYTDIMGAQDFGFQTLLFTPETPNYHKIFDYV